MGLPRFRGDFPRRLCRFDLTSCSSSSSLSSSSDSDSEDDEEDVSSCFGFRLRCFCFEVVSFVLAEEVELGGGGRAGDGLLDRDGLRLASRLQIIDMYSARLALKYGVRRKVIQQSYSVEVLVGWITK